LEAKKLPISILKSSKNKESRGPLRLKTQDRVGFSLLSFGRGDSNTKKSSKGSSTPQITASIVTSPGNGLCSFIGVRRDARKKSSTTNGGGNHHITVSRLEAKIQLILDQQATDAASTWSNPLSIESRLVSMDQRSLSTVQKLEVAYKVATSLFYLHSTPWLEDSWNSNDVFLPCRSDGSIIPDPLLSRRLMQEDNASAKSSKVEEESGMPSKPPIVTRLGRFLLELCFGATWADMQRVFLAGIDKPAETMDADLVVFNSVLSLVENPRLVMHDKPCRAEGWSYYEAVKNCFYGVFGSGKMAIGSDIDETDLLSLPMDDVDLWIDVYQKIVRPLQFALEDFHARQFQLYGPQTRIKREMDAPAESMPLKEALILFDDKELEKLYNNKETVQER
jgi:hypothetical protein